LNPRPHGPEIWAVPSTEPVFEGFEIDSRHSACLLDRFRAVSEPRITTWITTFQLALHLASSSSDSQGPLDRSASRAQAGLRRRPRDHKARSAPGRGPTGHRHRPL